MKFPCLAIASVLLVAPSFVKAQSFSYDGNRWYEIEVSIFTNESPVPENELVIPEKVHPGYPEPIRQLIPAVTSFMVDFDTGPDAGLLPASFPGNSVNTPVFGPMNQPGSMDFKILDFNRDPFIALGNDEAGFQRYDRDIGGSPDHRLLFHAVWRQPVLNRVQSTAVFVSGGNRYGMHEELEGSLLISYNINRVDVEATLWLSTFEEITGGGSLWELPERPFPVGDKPDFGLPGNYAITRLAYMNQLRSMTSNTLHYLDHPEFGLLIEIRPYQLPEPVNFSFE